MTDAAAAGGGDERLDRRAVTAGACLTFGVLFLRTAWISDDSYITFRTVRNVLDGYGLRWNIHNRVETFTHPLWLFVMTVFTAITGDTYYTAIFLSIALSLTAVALVGARLSSSSLTALIAFSALGFSKSFVEFSTSGLENALTYLLLTVFFVVFAAGRRYSRRRVFALSSMATLVMLNRLDTGLLVIPALAIAVWEAGIRRVWIAAAAPMLALAAWELLSLVYYGFPFPNTAYAKLKTGVPRAEAIYQGFLYLIDSVANDPVTPLVIIAALISPFAIGGAWAEPAGILLYVAYIVWIGGDFMSGRFLGAPLLCAVIHLARVRVSRPTVGWAVALLLIWVTGVTAPHSVVFANARYGADAQPSDAIPPSHITDERRYYYPFTGLLTARRGTVMPNHRWYHLGEEARQRGEHVEVTDAAGFIGYAAGSAVHFVDRWGLGDPLLARLPATAPWEIGHYARTIPDGYIETLETGRNMIKDLGVAAYYDRLRIITEGPIWSRQRLLTVYRMNLGRYEHLIASYGIGRVHVRQVSVSRPDGTPWNAPENVIMIRGLRVDLEAPAHARAIELSVSRNDEYRVELLKQDRSVYEGRINATISDDSSLITRAVAVPATVEFDAVRIEPTNGDRRYSLGHLRVVP